MASEPPLTIRVVDYAQYTWGPQADPPYEIVTCFLWQMVGRSKRNCDSCRFRALDVAKGNSPPSTIHSDGGLVAKLAPTWVLIQNSYNNVPEPAVITIDAFVSVLRYWKSVLAAFDGTPPLDTPEFSYATPRTEPPLLADNADQEFADLTAPEHELTPIRKRREWIRKMRKRR
jgi:hypothetical protein